MLRIDRMKRIKPARSIAMAEVPFGVAAGAALGAFAGPAGIVAGALIGSGVGAVLAIAQNRQMHRNAEGEDLYDEELGIIGGQLGSPNLDHPPATVGTYSAGSLGLASSTEVRAAEGPITYPDE